MEAKVYRIKCEESPIPRGCPKIVIQVTLKFEEGKKLFLLRLADMIKKTYKTPKLEADKIIEDKENDTSYKNNSGDKDIMFFVDVLEEKDL